MTFLTYGLCTGLLVCIAGSNLLSAVPKETTIDAYPRYEYIRRVNDRCELYRHWHSPDNSEVVEVCED